MENSLHEIETYLAVLGPHCRRGDYGDAAKTLNGFLSLLQNTDMRNMLARIPKGLLQKFNYSLETIFLMFKNQDWVAVADVVEYELNDIWKDIERALKNPD